MSDENAYSQINHEVMKRAEVEARSAKARFIEPIHLFIAACKQEHPPIQAAFEAHSLDVVRVRRRARGFARAVAVGSARAPTKLSIDALRAGVTGAEIAEEEGHPTGPSHLLAALLREPDGHLSTVFQGESLPCGELARSLIEEEGKADWSALADVAKADEQLRAEAHTEEKPASDSMLAQFGKDYTALAREGKLEPMIGRRAELKQVIRILLRLQKGNPVLLGEPGVGKTALVEGLAQFSVSDTAPPEVRRMRIVEVSLGSLVAGTSHRGEFEERLEQLVTEAEQDSDLVIFFDEIHTLVGAGRGSGAMDASNILKPALSRGAFRCMGATTLSEYRQYIEKDGALERRFQPVRIEEPSPDEAKEILNALRSRYEEHHQITIEPGAIEAAVDLSVRYLPDRRLPDKARDLLDQAAVAKRIQTISPGDFDSPSAMAVTASDVAAAVSEWTGIPVERLTESSKARFAKMEETLKKRVMGQDHAVTAVSDAIRTAMTGLGDPNRPHGVFLFMGPTGVGKTELAKALAEFLFEDERRLIRLDMSEFMEEHSVAKLIGSPPGYVGHEEGGRLTDAVRTNPYSVVLLDEIEKAHAKVFDLFLQVFDDGRLADSHGRVADFTNSVIILTSNLTAAVPHQDESPRVGFDRSAPAEKPVPDTSEKALRAMLSSHFRPEFVNRIGQIVPFHALGEPELRSIIDKLLDQVRARLADKDVALQATQRGYDALMTLGFQPAFGAREMGRVIDQKVVQPIARGLIDGTFAEGDAVVIDGSNGAVMLRGASDPDPLVAGSVLLSRLKPAEGKGIALFLVDLVGSTEMVVQGGDTHFVTSIGRLHDALQSHAPSGSMSFLKGTGDGFLAVFDNMDAVVAVSRKLRESLGGALDLRMVGHAGSVKIGPDGDPLGEEVHRLFRMEAVREGDRTNGPEGKALPPVPLGGLILLSAPALEALEEEDRSDFEFLGLFKLKGFDEPEGLWVDRS